MLLSLRPGDGLARADNLIPYPSGPRSRPGAVQTFAGAVEVASGWGGRVVVASGGAVRVLDQSPGTVLSGAVRGLAGTAYQALTADAEREDRFYVADGVRPLWYAVRAGTGYLRHEVTNTVLDAAGDPYPVPTSDCIATWRGRLWVGDGYRVRHSDNDAPAAWDPLNTLALQGAQPSRVRGLQPFGDRLVVGTEAGLWAITGTSQYNWQRDQIVIGRGLVGPRAIASDGARLWWISAAGLHELGASVSLSAGVLDALFEVPDPGAQLEVSPDGELLLMYVRGRLLVMSTRSGDFGEVLAPAGIYGAVRTDTGIGWYGPAGVWMFGGEDAPDVSLRDVQVPVTTVYETHDQYPNPQGRALCPRVWLTANGSDRGTLRYTASVDGIESEPVTLTLADAPAPVLFRAWDGAVRARRTAPVQREIPVHRAGMRFAHRLVADCAIEIRTIAPKYQFGDDPREQLA